MPKNQTCRAWKLSPHSCLLEPTDCGYAHHNSTDSLGPPVQITCWAWANGGCKLHDEGCLFSHYDTGTMQTIPSFTPVAPLFGRNRAIAKAAAYAGFDCSDVEKVMSLVNAVRQADSDAGYPDYYVGQSRRPSDFLPARRRQRHDYRDLDNPAVPAFTLDASQILRNIQGWGNSSFTYQDSHTFGTSKRTGTNYHAGAAKRLKTSRTTHTTMTNRVEIDLTKDEDPSYVHPSRRDQVPRANNVNKPKQQLSQQQLMARHEKEMRRVTTKALENTSRALSRSINQLANSRETLKKRWDFDVKLQEKQVTEDLGGLNGCFSHAENALQDAITVIEERLLKG